MMEPRIVYESKNIVALTKPAGYLVHALPHTTRSRAPTLTEWLLPRYPEIRDVGDDPRVRPGIVHRLDRETSGILLVARTQESFLRLKSLFQAHAVKKTYLALTEGTIPDTRGIIDLPISLTPGSVKRSVHGGKMTKEAITEYLILRRFTGNSGDFALCILYPKTGRTHQLRVHLAAKGTPIVGDVMYSKKKRDARLMLHALTLEFDESPGKKLRLISEPPADFAEELVSLGCYRNVEEWHQELEDIIEKTP